MDPLYDALLGQLAVDAGLLSQDQLAECIRIRESTGRPLGAILLEKGFLTDESLEKLLEARAEASYLGLFPLEVRKRRTTEMFAAAPTADAPPTEGKKQASDEIQEVEPVFPGEEQGTVAAASAETEAEEEEEEDTEEETAEPHEVEMEFISDTPLPEEPVGVPVAAFVDPNPPISEAVTDRIVPSAANLPDVAQDERSFGLLLSDCGLLNERRIEECLVAQKAIAVHGIRIRLGEILVRKGIASPLQIRDILRLQDVTLLHCPECLVNYNVHGYGQGGKATCPRCDKRLIVPVATAIDAVDTMTIGKASNEEKAPIEKFGRWLLFDELGHGQLGITYKAWDTQAGRLVALKRLCPIEVHVGEDLARIVEDAKPSLTIHHPCIAEVYEISDVEGDRCVASKFIEGIPLSKLIGSGQGTIEPPISLTPRNIADIARQVAEALGAAHAADAMHYDVKPSNILLDPDGVPHLTDLGLAIDQRPVLGDHPEHWKRPIRGTFPYIAPEAALDDSPIGPSADVFSLGVVIYELLTGRVPFTGETPEKVLYAISHTDPDPPSKWALNLPRDLERIVMKAIARDPGERYPDGGALATDLHRFVSGEALEGEEPMEVEPAVEPAPAPKARPVSERRPLRTQPALDEAEAPSGGKGKLVAVLVALLLIGGGVWAWLVPVKAYLAKSAARDAMTAGDYEVALAKWNELEATPEVLAERQKCQARIDAKKTADDQAAGKHAAQEALGKAKESLASAREALRAAAQGNPDRAGDGMQKLREAAALAEDAATKDATLEEAFVVRVQALALAGDAEGARAAAEKIPATSAIRSGVIPSLVALELAPLLAARGPLVEFVSPGPRVRFARTLPEPPAPSYKKRKDAVRALLAQLTEPGDLARLLSAGVNALLEGNAKVACEELTQASKSMPEEAAFHAALAVALHAAGDGDGAVRSADAALASRPDDPAALWARAAGLTLLGRPEADAARDKAKSADRKLGHAQLDTAMARLAAGRVDEALTLAQEVLAERSDDPRALLISARARLASGQADAALVEAGKALEAVQDFHAAHVLHGQILLALGKGDEAVKELEGCCARAADDLEAALLLARALVARKDGARAIPMLNRVVAAAPDWAEALSVRAEAKYIAKDPEGALEDATAALGKDPSQAQAARVRALVRIEKGEGGTVEGDITAAIEKFPKDVELLKARARIRANMGKDDSAIFDLTLALQIAPDDTSILLERARAYRRTRQTAEALRDLAQAASGGHPTLEIVLEKSLLEEETGDLTAALEDATSAVRTDGESAPAHAARARLLAASGQAAVATQDADAAVRIAPTSAEAWESRALVREALGQMDDAKGDIEKAISVDTSMERLYPTRARLRRSTGDAAGAMEDEERSARTYRALAGKRLEEARAKSGEGDFAAAADLAARAAWMDPGNVAAWRDRGFYRLKAGEAQGALGDLDRAFALDPKNADVLSQRGAVKKALKDYQGAVDDFTGALALDANRLDDRISRASALRSLGQKDKAMEEVNQALTEKPDAVEGLRLRAILRNGARDYAGAIEDATRALDLGGADAWTYYQRAYAHDATAKRQEALDDFTKAIEAKQDYADAYSHRGWVNLEVGNAAPARNDELEALKLSPTHAWAHFRLAAVYANESAKGDKSPLAGDGNLTTLAFDELGKAVDGGFTSRSYLEATRFFDPIRGDARYQQVLARLK